jgi:hypothetical protein
MNIRRRILPAALALMCLLVTNSFAQEKTKGKAKAHTFHCKVEEGHVPAPDIKRLLNERPKVVGLAVPGMPVGSPGLEAAHSEAFSVFVFDEGGHASVYARYPAR